MVACLPVSELKTTTIISVFPAQPGKYNSKYCYYCKLKYNSKYCKYCTIVILFTYTRHANSLPDANRFVLAGIGSGMLMIVCFAAVSQYFEKRVALAIGLAGAGAGVGSLLTPLLVKVLIDKYSFYGAFLINGAIVLHCIPLSGLIRPVKMKPLELHSIQGKTNPGYGTTHSRNELLEHSESVIREKHTKADSKVNSASRDFASNHKDMPTTDSLPRHPQLPPHKRKGFAWEIFKDVRIWIVCVCLMLADASAMNFATYLPLHSIEVGGEDVNEAFGVSFSGGMSAVAGVVWSALWDRGVFKKQISRQLGYCILTVVLGIIVAGTGIIKDYTFLMVWVVILQPLIGTGAMSPFHVIIRDIATPEKFPDALSITGLVKSPVTFLASIVIGKHVTSYLHRQLGVFIH